MNTPKSEESEPEKEEEEEGETSMALPMPLLESQVCDNQNQITGPGPKEKEKENWEDIRDHEGARVFRLDRTNKIIEGVTWSHNKKKIWKVNLKELLGE